MLSDSFFVTRWNKWITVNRLAVGAQISVYYQRRLSCDCESPAPVRDSWLPMLSCTTGHNTHEKKKHTQKKRRLEEWSLCSPSQEKRKKQKKNGEKGRKNKWIAVDQFNLIMTERSSTSQWIRVSSTYLEKRKWKGYNTQKSWDVPHENKMGATIFVHARTPFYMKNGYVCHFIPIWLTS